MVHEEFDLEDDEDEDFEEGEEVTSEADMEAWLENAILERAAEEGKDARAITFQRGGVLTMNKGLVVSIDGRRFQLTIVRDS